MLRHYACLACALTAMSTCLLPLAADEANAVHFDFEAAELPAGWYTTAPEGVLAITGEARQGRGALCLQWTPATGGALALIGVKDMVVEGRPQSLAFSFRTEGVTPLVFSLIEADGSSYQGYAYSEGGRWHDVLVDLDELMLSETDPDENERLNVDEIVSFTVLDLSNLAGEVGLSLGIKDGPQRMWLDDVRLTRDFAPHRSARTRDGVRIIDDFDIDPVPCLPLEAPRLSIVEGPDADDDGAVRIVYSQGERRWVGFVSGVGHLNLRDEQDLRLTLRADNAARLTVVLEERDGSKYTALVKLDPAEGWHTVRLPVQRFKLDKATSDENDALDMGQIRVIIPVIDAQRAEVNADGTGAWTLSRAWCGPVAD